MVVIYYVIKNKGRYAIFILFHLCNQFHKNRKKLFSTLLTTKDQ